MWWEQSDGWGWGWERAEGMRSERNGGPVVNFGSHSNVPVCLCCVTNHPTLQWLNTQFSICSHGSVGSLGSAGWFLLWFSHVVATDRGWGRRHPKAPPTGLAPWSSPGGLSSQHSNRHFSCGD